MSSRSSAEIATLLGKSDAACQQLLPRAKESVAGGRRLLDAPAEEHRRLLRAFVAAATRGDVNALKSLLAENAVLFADAGAEGARFGRARNLPGPLQGAHKIAEFAAAVTPQGAQDVTYHECVLNERPALVALRDGRPFCAIMLGVADGRIEHLYFQLDLQRLRHLGLGASSALP
jgi:RNA polymerase sigma-70 factor (ECF subfamily)